MQPTSNRKLSRSGRSRASGIALIEVLVAMLIFMLGVLGLIGLQSSMTRAQTESKVRADAAYLASELTARMWADLNNLAGYNGSGCASQTRCLEWQNKVASHLPSGAGAVAYDSGSGNVTVTVTWTLPNGDPHRYVTNTTVAKPTT